jgi:hypothetical protein
LGGKTSWALSTAKLIPADRSMTRSTSPTNWALS